MTFYHKFYLLSSNYINLIITAKRVRVNSTFLFENKTKKLSKSFLKNLNYFVEVYNYKLHSQTF